MLKPHAVGIAWYVRDDYPHILDIMVDADQMPETFDEWRERAIEVESQLKARGFALVRAPVHAPAFLAWCRDTGRTADADARCQYAADFAERREADPRPIQVKSDQADGDRPNLRRA